MSLTIRHVVAICLTLILLSDSAANGQIAGTYRINEFGQTSADFSHRLSQISATELVRRIRNRHPVVEDPALTIWINDFCHKLAHSARLRVKPRCLISQRNETNAITMIGGVIVVHAGLINQTRSEAALAGVLAHELAHAEQRHIERSIDSAASPWIRGLGVLASMAVAGQNPEAARAIMLGSTAFNAQRQVQFTHKAEQEADQVGLRILQASGYPPQGLAQFLKRMEATESRTYAEFSPYLRTHPLSTERIASLNARTLDQSSLPIGSLDYQLAMAKLTALTHHRVPLRSHAGHHAHQYLQALKFSRSKRWKAALAKLPPPKQSLISDQTRIKALLAIGHHKVAQDLLNHWQRKKINHAGLRLLQAQLADQTKQTHSVRRWLFDPKLPELTSVNYFEQGQALLQKNGFAGEAYQFYAERALRLGNYRQGIQALRQGLKLPQLNPKQRSTIQLRIRALEQALANAKKS